MALFNECELAERLDYIEKYMIKELPRYAQACWPKEPAYCLFLEYVDLSACQDFRPFLTWGLARVRSILVERHGDKASSYLWNPQESGKDVVFWGLAEVGDDAFHNVCVECWRHFADCFDPGNGPDEEEVLLPFRQVIQRVAMHFNTVDWLGNLPVTDDFIVYPTNWLGYMMYLDVEAGVPREKLERLREKGFFPFKDL